MISKLINKFISIDKNKMEVVTLLDAKSNYNGLHYDKEFPDNCLGIVKYFNDQFCDYNGFVPLFYNNEYLVETNENTNMECDICDKEIKINDEYYKIIPSYIPGENMLCDAQEFHVCLDTKCITKKINDCMKNATEISVEKTKRIK